MEAAGLGGGHAAVADVQNVCAALVEAGIQLQQPLLVRLVLRALVPLQCTVVGSWELLDSIGRASKNVSAGGCS